MLTTCPEQKTLSQNFSRKKEAISSVLMAGWAFLQERESEGGRLRGEGEEGRRRRETGGRGERGKRKWRLRRSEGKEKRRRRVEGEGMEGKGGEERRGGRGGNQL